MEGKGCLVVIGILAIIMLCMFCSVKTKINSVNTERALYKELMPPVENKKTIAIVNPLEDAGTQKKVQMIVSEQNVNAQKTGTTFVSANQVNANIASTVQNWIKFVSNKPGFSIVDRNHIEDILNQREWETSLWSESKKKSEIGKAKNADILLTFDINLYLNGNAVMVDGFVSFLDINTMQKISFHTSDYSGNPDLSAIFELSENSLNGKWYFDGLKVSSYFYKKTKRDYISPFAPKHSLKPASKSAEKKYANKLPESFSIWFYDDECIIESSERETECKVSLNIDKSKNYATSEIYSDKNDWTEIVETQDEYVNAQKLGKIKIRSGSETLIEGNLFIYGDDMCIEVGTSLSGETGKVYFLCFSR